MKKPTQLYITASKSSKMSKDLMIGFKNNVLNQIFTEKVCIIKDS